MDRPMLLAAFLAHNSLRMTRTVADGLAARQATSSIEGLKGRPRESLVWSPRFSRPDLATDGTDFTDRIPHLCHP